MSRFFVPAVAGSGPAAERAYLELRHQAESCTGAISRERRIEGVLCRRGGRDFMLRVGELDAGNGQTVAAIFQLGRDTYTVHHLGSSESAEPLVLHQSAVYSVTDFQ